MYVARLIGKRAAIFVASLLVASVIIFLACAALPGDVAQVILGTDATPAAVEALRHELGTDRPLIVQYLHWIGGLLTGDFGHSYLTRTPVATAIADRFAVTAWLVIGSMLLALVIAVPLGMWAAARRQHVDGFFASALSQAGLAIPAFWAGIMLVWVFAVRQRWFPAGGYTPLTTDPARWAWGLVLPVVALSLVQGAVLTRYVRSAFLEVLGEDYLRTARAIGWPRYSALLRHGLRNVAVQVVTVLGLQLSTLLVGAIVIEQVFAIPGLGSHLLAAVAERDLMVVQGTVMVLVFVVLLINFLVDLSYLAIDPRLRTRRAVR
ncbi:ABC transporter permease [Propionibacteriaceae bacterium Y2011]|uniref:ABC transporter permease n=1 Tax=Microlunatus sp. Y2014 TaxID=3418488 RepID=UPI003B452A60